MKYQNRCRRCIFSPLLCKAAYSKSLNEIDGLFNPKVEIIFAGKGYRVARNSIRRADISSDNKEPTPNDRKINCVMDFNKILLLLLFSGNTTLGEFWPHPLLPFNSVYRGLLLPNELYTFLSDFP